MLISDVPVFALRFLLGVFESTSWPGIVNLIFNWYTPRVSYSQVCFLELLIKGVCLEKKELPNNSDTSPRYP